MKFARVPVAESLGAILAHGTRLPGKLLPKGTVVDAATIEILHAAGITHVVAARLESGDVGEDTAAAHAAACFGGTHLRVASAETGRANIFAISPGLLRVTRAPIDAFNAAHEAITIATLPDATPVRAGDLLATIKIIPFAVPATALAAACRAAQTNPLRLAPFRAHAVGLVISTLPGLKESVLAGTEDVTRARVVARGGALCGVHRVPHTAAAMQAAIASLIADSAGMVLIAGASAVVDRADVAPAAIIAAGGQIDHFGMPVDPGNLLCLGHIGAVPAIVLPGCARSPKLNGIDFVLDRLFAGEPLGRTHIMAMGVGGLLKDTPTRPAPRTSRQPSSAIAAIILAAGLSRRMGPRNKLLVPDDTGVPMVARTLAQVQASPARPIYVVLGHQADAVRAALPPTGINYITAPNYADGLAASLRAGIAALPASISAALVFLADMPMITPAIIARLIAAYDPTEGRLIVVPTNRGKRGNPVLWDRRYFPDILSLQGDTGARALLGRYAQAVVEVEVADEAVLIDFDTPEALGAGKDKVYFSEEK